MINRIYELIGLSTMSLIDKKTRRTRLIVVSLCCLFMFALSLYMLFMFLHDKVYYRANDGFYYMAIADNLRQNCEFRNPCCIPSQPVITPQNAIVFIYYLLSFLIEPSELSLQVVVIINYISLLLSVIPLLGIAKRCGISDIAPRLVLVAVYLCGWHMIRYQLLPINDGLFRTGSLWLIYCIFRLSEADCSLTEMLKSQKSLFVVTCVLSAALIHFRLNAIVIPVAGLLSALLARRSRLALIMLCLAVVVLLSVMVPLFFIDSSRMQLHCQNKFAKVLLKFPHLIFSFGTQLLPAAIFRDLGTTGNMLYAAFPLSILLALIEGVRKKAFALAFIVLVCLFTFVFIIMYVYAPYRMLLMVYPLIYIILLRKPSLRPVGYLFAFAVILQTFLVFYNGIKPPGPIKFWTHVSQNFKIEESEYVLISDGQRYAYFFAKMRTNYKNEYQWHDLHDKNVYLAGPDDFQKKHKEKLDFYAQQNNCIIEYSNLTEEYESAEDYKFLQVKFKPLTP